MLSFKLGRDSQREETERLRIQHREDERRNRQGTYHRLLAVLDRFDTFATGYAPTDARFEEALADYNTLHGGVLLFGHESVKGAMGPITVLFEQVGAEIDESAKVASFARAYLKRRRQIIEAQGALVAMMAEDVQRGILREE